MISSDYVELHGDRCYGDDPALVGGICKIDGVYFTFLGQQKGRNMKENMHRNFGMANPEGYRKALRLAQQAARFNRPILTLVDTSGAYPGIEAEERGIAEAIARNLMEFSILRVPIISVIIGEGGSGGALGIAVADRVFMFENAIYSVISPEGFASILLRDGTQAEQASDYLKMTATDLRGFSLIDDIIPEPEGGAHVQPRVAATNLKTCIMENYEKLSRKRIEQLVSERSSRLLSFGEFDEQQNVNKPFFSKFLGKGNGA